MRTLTACLAAWLAAPGVPAQQQQPPATAPQSSVHARVLGRDGAALANADLQAMFAATYAYHGQPCRTGENGEVQIAVPDSFSQAPKSKLVVMCRKSTGLQPTEYGGAVSVDLPPSPHGLIQLGDLRLLEEPVLVSGMVVDSAGKPVAGVELSTQVSHFVAVQNIRIRGAGTVMGGTPFMHVAVSDAGGRFVMRELMPADTPMPLRVLREEMWQLSEAPEAKPGMTDLKVVVARTAAILVGMADAPKEGISVRVERRGDTGTGRPFQRTAEGLWRFGRLQPGTYDVRLVVQGEVVWSAEGVEVRAGEDCTDPRLKQLPWREHSRVVDLRVKDTQDRPLGALITVRTATSPERPVMFRTDKDGNATVVLLAEAPGTMEIGTAEHLTFRIDDPKGQIDVRMQPRPKVRVTAPPELQLPDGAVVQVGSGRAQAEATVRAGQDTIVRPDGAGSMPVRVCVRANKAEFQQVWSGVIDVAPGEAVQDRVLGIDKLSIEKLREMLSAKHQ
jgi:hypothetical protein